MIEDIAINLASNTLYDGIKNDEENKDCIHSDVHDLKFLLNELNSFHTIRKDILKTIVVQPSPSEITVDRHDRKYDYFLSTARQVLQCKVPGVGTYLVSLGVGWNKLDLPSSSLISTQSFNTAFNLLHVSSDNIYDVVQRPITSPPTVLYSQVQNITGGGYSSIFTASPYSQFLLMVSLIGITGGGGLQVGMDYYDPFGNRYDVADTSLITTAGNSKIIGYGPATPNNVISTDQVSVHWFLTGTTPTANFNLTLVGK